LVYLRWELHNQQRADFENWVCILIKVWTFFWFCSVFL
jgi:hypothetical protein